MGVGGDGVWRSRVGWGWSGVGNAGCADLCMYCREEEEKGKCSIPGLEGRQLEFLGLFGCAYNACSRKHIPAKRVRPFCLIQQNPSFKTVCVCLNSL